MPDPRSRKRNKAFTLVEVLVVVLIIGIIINIAVISLGGKTADPAQREASRLIALLNLAVEEALFNSELIGVAIEKNQYSFMRLQNDSWSPIGDGVLRSRKVPEEIELKLLVDAPKKADMANLEHKLPDIVILPTGESTPFELKIAAYLNDDFYRITGTEIGEYEVEHVVSN